MTSRPGFAQFLRQSGLGRWGLAVTLLLILAAVFASHLAPFDPAAQNLPQRLLGPNRAHWFGTDELGRDIFSRVLFGARISMLVGVSVVCGCGLTGLLLGLLAGYFGGWFDRAVYVILHKSFLSFPGILLAIPLSAFLRPGTGKSISAFTVPRLARYPPPRRPPT